MEQILQYRTRDGDVVDAICYQLFGRRDGYAELVLEKNPGLADHGPILPDGLIIELPDPPPTATPIKSTIRLWD